MTLNTDERQLPLIPSILVLLGSMLCVVGWLRWAS